jgi:hypothetical protein
MARRLSDRAHRQRIFLQALAGGSSIVQACAHGRISWPTLYRWRRQDAAFRAAWDEALRAGADAIAARFDGELMRRAVDGVDEPVLHNGKIVGERKRYSDRLLMFGIRDLHLRRAAASPPAPPSEPPPIRVVVRQFGPPAGDSAAAEMIGEDAQRVSRARTPGG